MIEDSVNFINSQDKNKTQCENHAQDKNYTQCEICFRHCVLRDGQIGFCRARICQNNQIIPLNYAKITGIALDPIEKKPLRRFYPGSMVLSIGSFGCNLRCPFCQNHEISMAGLDEIKTTEIPPEKLLNYALELRSRGNIGVAYTYNEPLICYEYVTDCAKLIKRNHMANILVTNGSVAEKPWRELLPLIDAVNIDLKGFTPEYYRNLNGDLETVKRAIILAHESGCHVEVTTLLIPGENDSQDEIRALAQWLANIHPDIPLHLSRFFPRYRYADLSPTPIETVYQRAADARQFLRYVYTGNC